MTMIGGVAMSTPATVEVDHSPTIGALAKALAAAQAKIKHAKKEAVNPAFGQGRKYADLSNVWDAIREPLSANGLAVVQLPEPHGKDGVMLATMLIHESGEWIRSKLYLPVSKADAQGFGSALTYARRYGLAAIAGVCPDDDDANEAVGTPKPPRGPLKGPAPQAPVGEKLAASVGAIDEANELGKTMATAPTVGALLEQWHRVMELRPALPAQLMGTLTEIKDARKKHLAGQAA